MSPKKEKYYILSLGCAKNLVDSNAMGQLLQKAGFQPTDNPRNAKYLIVNTCGFIEESRIESAESIAHLVRTKKPHQELIAAGCMTQRYQNKMNNMVPGIDAMFGTRRWMDIVEVIKQSNKENQTRPYLHFPFSETMGKDEREANAFALQGKSSYLKIADGCRRQCAFCAIPMIKGSIVSRPMESILNDAIILQEHGVQEINLIAQDITDYKFDQNNKNGLVELLQNILKVIPSVPWIRLLYTFPGYVSDELINLMAQSEQIVNYLDMPLQHADQAVLRSMQRPSDMDWVRSTIEKMRHLMPDLALRTTFIVGYPTETEKAFSTLLEFVKEMQFDHVGAFTYSFEEGTPAEKLGDPIPSDVKAERLELLMQLQAEINFKKNRSLIGKKLNLLIEGRDLDNNIIIGRTFRDAPEIDGLVIVNGQTESDGLLPVTITGASTYDLYATPS